MALRRESLDGLQTEKMNRFDLLNGAFVVAPKEYFPLDDYRVKHPEVSFKQFNLEELIGFFCPSIGEGLFDDLKKIIPLSEGAWKLLLCLLSSSLESPRFQKANKIPSLIKPDFHKDFFKGKNVVYMGYPAIYGKVFAALMQHIPNLSSSWALKEFKEEKGLSFAPLEELYSSLSETEIKELCLPSFGEYRKGISSNLPKNGGMK